MSAHSSLFGERSTLSEHAIMPNCDNHGNSMGVLCPTCGKPDRNPKLKRRQSSINSETEEIDFIHYFYQS